MHVLAKGRGECSLGSAPLTQCKSRESERSMLKTIFSKISGRGRAIALVVVALIVLTSGTAMAITYTSSKRVSLRLNKPSYVATALTRLASNAVGPALTLETDSQDPSATPLKLDTEVDSQAPMSVDSSTKVTNLNADQIDGQNSTAFASAYKSTVVVSPVGTATQNGTALKNALAGITNASQTNPYLLKIEPGVYDLGSSGSLAMKEHVDMEGSGELTTVITSSVTQGPGAEESCPIGTIAGANDTELRFLTVRNTGTGFCNIAIRNERVSPRLTHVTVQSTGVQGADTAYMGVYNVDACTTISDATVTASDFGVYSAGCSVLIKQSKISSEDLAVRQNPGISYVANTQVVGTTSGAQCFNSYDENLQPHNCG